MVKNIAVIQARMGSTRFPGKVLHKIAGRTILDRVISGVASSKKIDKIVVATTNLPADDVLAEVLSLDSRVSVVRGSSDDVLSRYFFAVEEHLDDEETNIIRITADCPLINSHVIDHVIELRERTGLPYVSNVSPPTYPDGFDVEVFSIRTLHVTEICAVLRSDREHVTPYMRRHFDTANYGNHNGDFSDIRLTVDHPDDADFIEEIAKFVNIDEPVSCDVLRWACTRVADIRSHRRNEGYELSLQNDV